MASSRACVRAAGNPLHASPTTNPMHPKMDWEVGDVSEARVSEPSVSVPREEHPAAYPPGPGISLACLGHVRPAAGERHAPHREHPDAPMGGTPRFGRALPDDAPLREQHLKIVDRASRDLVRVQLDGRPPRLAAYVIDEHLRLWAGTRRSSR